MVKRSTALLLPAGALLLSLGILIGRSAQQWLPAALASLLCAFLWPRAGLRAAASAGLVLAAGFLLGWIGWHPAVPAPGSYEIRGIVADEVTVDERGHLRSRLTGVTLDGAPARGDAAWTCYLKPEEAPPLPGQEVSFSGSVFLPSSAENPGGFDYRDYLLGKGVAWCAYGSTDLSARTPSRFSLRGVMASLRHRWQAGLASAMGEEAGAYAAAMLLGTRSMISDSDQRAFSRLGIAHVLSVSGFHTGILVGALNLLLRRRSRWFTACAHMAVLGAYALLTGGNAPVIRAALLVLLSDAGRLRHRQRSSLHAVCGAWVLMLLWRPALLVSAAFQLSFAAILGIVAFMPVLRGLFRGRPAAVRAVGETFSLSLSAQLGVLLPGLYWFQQLPLLGVLLSPLILLSAGVLILLDWLTLLLLPFPALSGITGGLGSGLLAALLRLIRRLDELPALVLWTPRAGLLTLAGWALLLLGACALWTRRKRLRKGLALGGALLLAVSLIPLPHTATEYLQLSLGNEDAAVLWDQGSVTVIDCGTDGAALASFLRQRRLNVDTVILTHLHTDHAGGLRALLEEGIGIRQVWLAEGAEDMLLDPGMAELLSEVRAAGIPLRHAAAGDTLSLPSGSLTVLWPQAGKTRPGQNANFYSMALLAELRGTAMLLAGDLDGRYERYAARKADILRVAHHGSSGSTGEAFLAAVAPDAAVVSAQADRQASFQARYPDLPVYGTGTLGAVSVRFLDGGEYTLSGFLPGPAAD